MFDKSGISTQNRFQLEDIQITASGDDLNILSTKLPGNEKSSAETEMTIGTGNMKNYSDKGKNNDIQIDENPIVLTRFDKVIPTIGNIVEAGYVCFLNPDSLQTEYVSAKMLDNPEAFYASPRFSSRQKPFSHLLWNNCLMFEPVPEKELVRLVEGFMQQLTDSLFCKKISRLITRQKSYAKLNLLILKSKHAAGWASYKEKYIGSRVMETLAVLLKYEQENS